MNQELTNKEICMLKIFLEHIENRFEFQSGEYWQDDEEILVSFDGQYKGKYNQNYEEI